VQPSEITRRGELLQGAQAEGSRNLVGFVGLDDEGIAGRAALLEAVHHDHKAIRRGLRANVDPRILPPQQVLYECGLACTSATELALPLKSRNMQTISSSV
jgi:hypothetical protein